jgi:hypothetical protein
MLHIVVATRIVARVYRVPFGTTTHTSKIRTFMPRLYSAAFLMATMRRNYVSAFPRGELPGRGSGLRAAERGGFFVRTLRLFVRAPQ